MSDRSNKPSFAVSRKLKHAEYHFIEAITDKLTESSNTTPNSVSTSTWLCVTSNMISTSHKTWQTSLLFSEPLQIQNLKKKSGRDIAYYVTRVPHQIAPMLVGDMSSEQSGAVFAIYIHVTLRRDIPQPSW